MDLSVEAKNRRVTQDLIRNADRFNVSREAAENISYSPDFISRPWRLFCSNTMQQTGRM